MKYFLFLSVVVSSFLAQAGQIQKADFIKAYSDFAFAQYQQSFATAQALKVAVDSFVANPTQKTQDAAKTAWVEARKAYLPTEVLRFAEGPIDREGGPEGFINSWPLDEASIDYVIGNKEAGIINDKSIPEITKEILLDLNQKAGETNVTTGYHAIEFLLWGQDVSAKGPGNRSFKDYIIGHKENADRRGQYLKVATEILVGHLQDLVTAWDPVRADSYYNFMLSPENTDAQTKIIFEALAKFTGEELSQERMFVAYDTQSQEEEHSCFSDTTHLDFIYDFVGVQKLLNSGMLSLVSVSSPDLKASIESSARITEQAIADIPVPFDQAILNEQGRKKILKAITGLEQLAEGLRKAVGQL